MKRLSIRVPVALYEDLSAISQKRGLTMNALITDMAWHFSAVWNKKMQKLKSMQEDAKQKAR